MSKEFTEAAASYFGMDPAAVADAHLTTNAEGLTVHFKMRLSDDDMIGIGKRMEERRKKPLVPLGSSGSFAGYENETCPFTGDRRQVYSAPLAQQASGEIPPLTGHP